MRKLLHSIAGVGGSEIVVLLAIGAIVLIMSGQGPNLDAMAFASSNF